MEGTIETEDLLFIGDAEETWTKASLSRHIRVNEIAYRVPSRLRVLSHIFSACERGVANECDQRLASTREPHVFSR